MLNIYKPYIRTYHNCPQICRCFGHCNFSLVLVIVIVIIITTIGIKSTSYTIIIIKRIDEYSYLNICHSLHCHWSDQYGSLDGNSFPIIGVVVVVVISIIASSPSFSQQLRGDVDNLVMMMIVGVVG